jgi:hypothetical protein
MRRNLTNAELHIKFCIAWSNFVKTNLLFAVPFNAYCYSAYTLDTISKIIMQLRFNNFG